MRIVAMVYDRSSGFGTQSSLVTIDAAGGDRKPVAGTEGVRSLTMRTEELAMLVNGLDVKQTKQRNWYRKSA